MRVVKSADERRKEIIEAARKYLQSDEFRTITMQILIDRVGIAKGTLYHHFKSKGEILEAVVETIVEEEFERKKKILEKHSEFSAIEKFKILLSSNMAQENKGLLENLHHPDNAHAHGRQLAKIILKIAPIYADIIKQGCEEGIFSTVCPLESAEFLLAGLQFLTDEGFFPWNEEDLQRRQNNFAYLLEAQLGAKAGTFNFLES